jgi:hypothetical protein
VGISAAAAAAAFIYDVWTKLLTRLKVKSKSNKNHMLEDFLLKICHAV